MEMMGRNIFLNEIDSIRAAIKMPFRVSFLKIILFPIGWLCFLSLGDGLTRHLA